jgi:hypothetical protein
MKERGYERLHMLIQYYGGDANSWRVDWGWNICQLPNDVYPKIKMWWRPT